MPTKPPSELEMQRAARYMRHVENCSECYNYNHPKTECNVGTGHWRRWARSYYREARGACVHLQEGECWEDRCKGGRQA